MENVKIKICDIRDVKVAKYCEEQGVSFLGIHQIKYPLTQEKKEMVHKIKLHTDKIKLVLVTQEQDMEKLLEMCLEYEWDYIQLHFKISPNEILKIKDYLKNNSSNAGIISVIDISNIEDYDVDMLGEISDFLLFDSSIRGGTGKTSSIEALKKIPQIAQKNKFFIAGGLNSDNVANIISMSKPYAVDVQSGVEFSIPELKHKKDPKRIAAFVNAVEKYNNQFVGKDIDNDDNINR